MPTALPRHTITETPEIAEALRAAAQRWPEDADRPARLLARLALEGERLARVDIERRRQTRLELAGSLSEVWGGHGREGLDDEWPT